MGENWSYDNLTGGMYRIRLNDGTRARDFAMSPGVRWSELKTRLKQELVLLNSEPDAPFNQFIEGVDYSVDDLGKGQHRVSLLNEAGNRTLKAVEFEMPANADDIALSKRITREVAKLRA